MLERWWQRRYPYWDEAILVDRTPPPDTTRALLRLAHGRVVIHRSVWALAATALAIAVAGIVVGGWLVPDARGILVNVAIALGWLVIVSTAHHELAHAWQVRRRGHHVVRFGLRGSGAYVAYRLRDGHSTPRDAVGVQIAGPASNLAMALLAAAAAVPLGPPAASQVVVIALVEAATGVTNLVPIGTRNDGCRLRASLRAARHGPRAPAKDVS